MSYALKNAVAYSLDALSQIPALPIVAKRAPIGSDKAPIGTLWVYSITNEAFILTEILNNVAIWNSITAAGGGGVFTSLVVTPGPVTITADSTFTGTTVFTGVTAVNGAFGATSLYATGDSGGEAATTGITNVTDNVQGAGVLTILSTTANAADNTGFLKFYVGVTPVFVPYFVNIAP